MHKSVYGEAYSVVVGGRIPPVATERAQLPVVQKAIGGLVVAGAYRGRIVLGERLEAVARQMLEVCALTPDQELAILTLPKTAE